MRRASAAEWAAWATTMDTDLDTGIQALRPAATPELLNRGVVVAHTDPATADVFFHVGKIDPPAPGEFPGEAITPVEGPDVYLRQRHRALPPEHRARFYQARVYRSLDGSNLRSGCETAVAAKLGARVPATGRTSGQPADPAGALSVLEEARRRATPVMDATGKVTRAATAQALRIPMAEVTSADVVEEDVLIGHRWAGEPDS
ncbi:MAG TPA: hypothetical protein VGR37_09020 [Longimicrobiaceae bacterium]|nr:hypothetical protein [Longimicrobiaceae bacterium]